MKEDASKSWLSKVADKRQARCRLYKKDFELSNMGKNAFLSHAAGKKYSERDKNLQIRRKLLTIISIMNLNQLKMTMVVTQILLHM